MQTGVTRWKVCALMNAIFLTVVTGYNIDTKYPISFNSTPKNYFGYSVALLRNRKGPRVLVTAPRANSTVLGDEIFQPGVLFSCNISTRICQEVVLDTKEINIISAAENSFWEKRDNMWLGVSLDVQQKATNQHIVTCGHLWKNHDRYIYKDYLANGVCYVINSELAPNSVKKLLPLVNINYQTIDPRKYYYGFGQTGTSAAFTEDGEYLLLGAPGIYDWSGTVLSYRRQAQNGEFSGRPVIPHPVDNRNFLFNSYIGYSVTSGKFFNKRKTFIAAGAPRNWNSHGRVFIFEASQSRSGNLEVHLKLTGKQFGEYFGAAVLGIDLNNDNYADLLVGAPFSSTESGGDEGKVYVYISDGKDLHEFDEIFGENKPNSRFGTCIASISDINQDGFNDVAIGAPYEDVNGAVYIYHGTAEGLNIQYVQRLSAAKIDRSLLGFGISISRGVDIDENNYPDLLVGSYASSKAILYRTSPVIQLSAKLDFNPPQINTNVTSCEFGGKNVSCIDVTACVHYTGKHGQSELKFASELKSSRGYFITNDESVIRQQLTLEIGKDRCFTEKAYIRAKMKDIINPIQFHLNYRLVADTNPDTFCKTCPVIDLKSAVNIAKAISFQTGCKKENECDADLIVRAHIVGYTRNKPLIIGKNSTLTVDIQVSNEGEPAYIAELLIYLPSETTNVNQGICEVLTDQQKQETNASLQCDLGNPLQKGKPVNFQIKIDVSELPTNKEVVEIVLKSKTESNEINPTDNELNISILFKTVADVSIFGTTEYEQILYNEQEEDQFPVSISHTYFVTNHGPSPLDVIDIELRFPTSLQGKHGVMNFLNLTNLEADSGKPLTIPAKCNTSIELKLDGELIADGGNYTALLWNLNKNSSQKRESSVSHVSSQSKKSANTSPTKKRKDFIINCKTANCMVIQCFATPFLNNRKFAQITVSAQIDIAVLNENLDPWHKIEFVTSGKVSIRGITKNIQPKDHQPDETSVKTVLIHSGPPPSQEVQKWIIFVSIGIGVLLLIIILIILIKIGFFKRQQKDEMRQRMMQADLKKRPTDDDTNAF